MRKKLGLILSSAILCMAVCLQGCSKSSENATQGEIKRTFIIGELFSETGENAAAGTSLYHGTSMAVSEINDNGGVMIDGKSYQLKLIGVDDESNADMAKNAYNTLVDKDAQAIIGPLSDEACAAVEKMANEDNMLIIMPSSTSSSTGKYDNSFRMCMSDYVQGAEIADYAFYHMNCKNAAVIYPENDSEMVESFVNKFTDSGGNILAREMYSEDLQQIAATLDTINAASPDIVFIPAESGVASDLLTLMENNDMQVSVIGDSKWYGVSPAEYENIGQVAYLSPYSYRLQEIAEEYQLKYNRSMDLCAAQGYDAVYAIKSALEEAGNVDSDLQICAMSVISFDGITGREITFDENGESNREIEFITLH